MSYKGTRLKFDGTTVPYRYDIELLTCVERNAKSDYYYELSKFRVLMDGNNIGVFDTFDAAENWIIHQVELQKI